ncbi:MAG TPA: single-stranded DNA-binding protein [Conexibacter sp.]|jgi:hypothetical protein
MSQTANTTLCITTATIIGNPELRPYGRDNADNFLRTRIMVPGIGRAGGNGFLDVAVFEDAETLALTIDKGTKVAFNGELRFREWEDKHTGAKRSALSATGTLTPLDTAEAPTSERPAARAARRGAAK